LLQQAEENNFEDAFVKLAFLQTANVTINVTTNMTMGARG
jgi:hypothetical protein